MVTPKPPTPTPMTPPQPAASVTATIIAEVESGVTRLAAVAVPLAITAADTIADKLPGLLAHMRASLESTAVSEERSELAAAASDLVGTGARLTLGLLNVAVRGLDAVRQAVGEAVTESGAPPRT